MTPSSSVVISASSASARATSVGSTRAIWSAIAASCGGTIWAPSPRYTLYPLSVGGLCDAVTITPAVASSSVIDQASTGVGSGSGRSIARTPGGGHHPRRVLGEHVALAADVVADDDAALGSAGIGRLEVVGQPGRRLAHDESVHPQRPGADGGAQPGGPERQAARRTARPAPPDRRRSAPAARRGCRRPARRRATASPAGSVVFGQRHLPGLDPTSVRSSTRGLGPTWLITSAAAIEPSRAQSCNDSPLVRPCRNPAA